MFCPKCGKEYDDSFAFCPHCGAENPYTQHPPDPATPTPQAVDQSPKNVPSETTQAPKKAKKHAPPPPVPSKPPSLETIIKAPPSVSKYYPNATEIWQKLSKKVKVLLVVACVVVIAVVIAIGAVTSHHSKTTSQTSNTTFMKVGDCVSTQLGGETEAESYYVSNPTKSEITKFCKQQESERLDGLKEQNRGLVMSFYDDEANTPDYAQGYDPTDESLDAYRVADYVINSSTGVEDVVTFSKEIPE